MTTINNLAMSRERGAVALVLAVVGALLLAVFATALHVPMLIALLASFAIAAALVPWTARRLPREWDGAALRHRVVAVLWLVLALLVIARLAGIALFMADPDQAQASAFWFDPFYIRHNCFSGYWQAAVVARDLATNVYDPAHYYGTVDRFKLDEFLYLPQFLILPLTGLALGGDFLALRAAWFSIEAVTLLAAMIALCAYIGGATGRRAALLIAVVWLASPTLLTLQLGNFQLAALAMTLLAMVAFERGRDIAGGALFGFAIFKLFPGVLGIYLLVQRRWRAALWTFAFSALYTVIAWLWLGREPFEAFVSYQLPRIVTGEAWAFLEQEGLGIVVAINDSVPGIVLKLGMLGIDGMTRDVQNVVAAIWTIVVVALTVLAALRAPRQTTLERAASWLAILALASMRSPFLPDHSGLFAPLWLWSLVAAAAVPMTRGKLVWFVLAAIALSAVLPFGGMPLPNEMGRLAISSISQAIALALPLWVVLRRPDAARANPVQINTVGATALSSAAPTQWNPT